MEYCKKINFLYLVYFILEYEKRMPLNLTYIKYKKIEKYKE